VSRHHAIPLVEIKVLHATAQIHACIREDALNAAMQMNIVLNHGGDRSAIRNIDKRCVRAMAAPPDFISRLGCSGGIMISNHDMRSPRQPHGCRPADTTCAAGNDDRHDVA
jgi:hypothetical protein